MMTDEPGKNGHWPNWPRAEKWSKDGAPKHGLKMGLQKKQKNKQCFRMASNHSWGMGSNVVSKSLGESVNKTMYCWL